MIIRTTQELAGSPGHAIRNQSGGSTILNLQASTLDYGFDASRLAVVCAWNGRQEVSTENRRVMVDDDTWLAIASTPATVRLRAAQNVDALTILFRAGLPEEVLGTLLTGDDSLLEDGELAPQASLPFIPHLQPHDRSVTPVLLFIKRHCDMGLDDPLWYEEQLAFLLERMLQRHRHVMSRARGVPVRRAATQREILRRVSLATDFIHSSFERPLMLHDMARSAFLSRHHFLRLFKHIHDVTPHEYLQRKRTMVAARLLRNTALAVEEVVKQVGFDSRSTLFRAMRRFHGVTPRECRYANDIPSFMSGAIAAA